MKKINTLLIIMFGIILVSCQSTTYQAISPVIADPSYAADIKPIIDSKCVGCHNNGGQYPSLETYDEVKAGCTAPEQVVCRISGTCGQIMPQSGPMPEATVTMIKTWVNKGFKN